MKRTKTGFTLVELVVVIAIVALLATILTPNVLKSIDKAKITKTVADLKTIKQAAIGIYTSLGVFPAEGASCSDRGFVTNSAVPANLQNKWEGPYLEKWPNEFPWGSCVTYLYGDSGSCFDLDGVANNDAFVRLDNPATNAFTIAIKQKIDAVMDDGNLAAGLVRDCRSGLVYYIGEGSRW